MDLSAALTADITDLTAQIGLDPDAITEPLLALDRDLGLAVASYVGLQLSLTDHGQPITVAAFRPGDSIDIASSLHLPLAAMTATPADDVVSGQAVTFYAGTPGAFVDLAADLSYVLRLAAPQTGEDEASGAAGPPRIRLDQHLTPTSTESGVTGVADASVVNRAVGYLVGQGWDPDKAHDELSSRATAAGITVVLFATQLIRPPGP